MKRTILVLLLIIGSMPLKAQQPTQAKPDTKLNNGLQNSFKPNDWLSPQVLLTQPVKKSVAINTDNITICSTMPTVKTSNVDRMPIVVPGDPNVHYTMLIKKVDIVDPLAPVQTQQPKP
jgi:hypothetical protein